MDINQQNNDSLDHFKSLLAILSPSELSTPMPAGWTVSAVLVHLAFWDKRALTLLEKWQKEGITFSPMDIDVVNEVTRPLCLAIPTQIAIELFLQTAEAVDQLIGTLDPAWLNEVQENGKNVHLNRAKHRLVHMEEIKAVLDKP
jgi:hypothetical protein